MTKVADCGLWFLCPSGLLGFLLQCWSKLSSFFIQNGDRRTLSTLLIIDYERNLRHVILVHSES